MHKNNNETMNAQGAIREQSTPVSGRLFHMLRCIGCHHGGTEYVTENCKSFL